MRIAVLTFEGFNEARFVRRLGHAQSGQEPRAAGPDRVSRPTGRVDERGCRRVPGSPELCPRGRRGHRRQREGHARRGARLRPDGRARAGPVCARSSAPNAPGHSCSRSSDFSRMSRRAPIPRRSRGSRRPESGSWNSRSSPTGTSPRPSRGSGQVSSYYGFPRFIQLFLVQGVIQGVSRGSGQVSRGSGQVSSYSRGSGQVQGVRPSFKLFQRVKPSFKLLRISPGSFNCSSSPGGQAKFQVIPEGQAKFQVITDFPGSFNCSSSCLNCFRIFVQGVRPSFKLFQGVRPSPGGHPGGQAKFQVIPEGQPKFPVISECPPSSNCSSRRLNCFRTLASVASQAPKRRVKLGTLSARDTPSTAASSALVATVRLSLDTPTPLAPDDGSRGVQLRALDLIIGTDYLAIRDRGRPCRSRDSRRRSRRGSPRTIAPDSIDESSTSENPPVVRFVPGRLRRLGQPRGHIAPVGRRRVRPAERTRPGRQQLVVSHPLQTAAAMGVAGITRPGPRRRMLHQSAPNRVEVHVSRHRPEVGLIFHQFGTIAALEHMPGKAVASRPAIGIAERNACMPRLRLGWGS